MKVDHSHDPAGRASPGRMVVAFGLPVVVGLLVLGLSRWLEQEPAQAAVPGLEAADATAEAGQPEAGNPEGEAVAQAPRERPRIRAPELDGGVAWLNTAGPIRMADLKGKIVILDFWTLCCINCIHTLPDLARLEKKYANQLVVIGVHSAKFDNEKESESIRKAILRYEIQHPVVNDANMKIWRTYDVHSWPTLYLIDPEGYIVGRGSGEGLHDALDRLIEGLIKEHRAKKTLNEEPLRFDLARFKERGDSPLYFPGKVLADAAGKRLFIADSTHHRLVVTDLAGKQLFTVGDGEPGQQDGPFDKARFNDPQGMALDGDRLYVADRKNHLIRAVDLKARTVTTIAGTGEQGTDRFRGGPALKTGLNSPWDLLLYDGKLFIAMAGHHQIWTLDLKAGRLAPYAGDGREDLGDGLLDESHFAQPSGLASDGKHLYVADSETSSIRQLPLNGKGTVKTIVGQGLFDFGDVDGQADKVRLQHALAVAWVDGQLFVADTYNSKLKVIDPARRSCTTYMGSGAGWLAGSVFNEPGGLSYAAGKLYVADTNAHRIRVVDLKDKTVSTLALEGVEAPKPYLGEAAPTFPNARRTTVAARTVPADGELTLQVEIRQPKGFKLNPDARMRYLVETLDGARVPYREVGSVAEAKPTFLVRVPVEKLAGAPGLRLSVVYYECSEGSKAICRIRSQIWEIPLKFDASAKDRVVPLYTALAATDDNKK